MNKIKTTIDESGTGGYLHREHFSYIKLDFNRLVLILNNNKNLNLFTNLIDLIFEEKMKTEHLYNQFLFVFDNIL